MNETFALMHGMDTEMLRQIRGCISGGDMKVHGGDRKVTLYIEDNLEEDSKLHVHLKH